MRTGRPFGAAPSRSAVAVLAAILLLVACSDDFDPDQALQEGLAQQQAGNLEEAADLYLRILEVRPGDKFANYNMGVIEQRSGRAQVAEGYYRAALDTDPDFAAAMFNLAILRTNVGATQEAIDLYMRVIDVQPENAAAHLNLGLLYANAGKEALAEGSITRALELDPSLIDRLGPDQIPSEGDAEASPAGETGSEAA
jgi:tetratricopeptide (TPR) repeat protein